MKKLAYLLFVMLSVAFLLLGCSKENNKEDKKTDSGESKLERIAGTWEGSINIPNQPLPIIIVFTSDGGTISIPVQGIDQHPLSNINIKNNNVAFAMDIQSQQITFNGKVDGEKITGTFKQSGQSFPFELKKGTGEATKEVKEVGEAVHMELKDGTMKGLLTIPEGEGPYPLMVIISGSGPTDKDGNSNVLSGKNDSLKMLAEDLAAQGVASIRYDKRGIGQNISLGGKEEDVLFDNFIEDAASWVQFAKADKRFSKVGIIGHSEGSLIGMTAADEAKADAFISISGAGRTIDQVILEQLEGQLSENLMKESKDIFEQLKQGKQVKSFSADLQNLFRLSVQPYLISWLQYNPQEQLQKLDCPVFIINGDRDLQVPVKEAELLHGAKKDSDYLIVDKMNHILKESPEDQKGNMDTYTNPDLPLASGLVDNIVNFLNNHNVK
ncbi:S9 family peptidase [Bacillus sp. S/N-304-OC-R1]|uniref:alpha/beta hydrolase family protein n=1 Tax=Bacillus sp. S/N-304-OC-R1 TaxID=2758034 RepID=UPI001C8DF6BF|nr:alpha/beta hydrolase [Bacillus sp. S/N-304-OC-R1]MBY0123021.1 alpha/beta hydrolase [Bacillus sp. S/N-304-OC-R1]